MIWQNQYTTRNFPALQPSSSSTNFLADKEKILSELQALSSPEEFAQRLQEVASKASGSIKAKTSSESSVNYNKNEDDFLSWTRRIII